MIEKKSDNLMHVQKKTYLGSRLYSNMLITTQQHAMFRKELRERCIKAGVNMNNIPSTQVAHLLITKKVLKATISQCINALSRCFDSKLVTSVQVGKANCRNISVHLPTCRSLQGTSHCETTHSIFTLAFFLCGNYRSMVY